MYALAFTARVRVYVLSDENRANAGVDGCRMRYGKEITSFCMFGCVCASLIRYAVDVSLMRTRPVLAREATVSRHVR